MSRRFSCSDAACAWPGEHLVSSRRVDACPACGGRVLVDDESQPTYAELALVWEQAWLMFGSDSGRAPTFRENAANYARAENRLELLVGEIGMKTGRWRL